MSSRSRNQNIVLNYIDKVKNGQVRLLELSEESSPWENSGDSVYLRTSANNVGIGTSSPLGKLHIVAGNPSGQTPHSVMDTLVIDSDESSLGISLIGNTISNQYIGFGDTANNFIGAVYYQHSTDTLRLYANNNIGLELNSDGDVSLPDQPRVSVTMTGIGTASAAPYNVFDEDNWTFFSQNANIVETNITYSSSDGRFTVTPAGTYLILVNLVMISSVTTTVICTVRVNGSIIHTQTVHASADPVERTICLLATLTAGQYVEVYVGSTTVNTITMEPGTTFSMCKIA